MWAENDPKSKGFATDTTFEEASEENVENCWIQSEEGDSLLTYCLSHRGQFLSSKSLVVPWLRTMSAFKIPEDWRVITRKDIEIAWGLSTNIPVESACRNPWDWGTLCSQALWLKIKKGNNAVNPTQIILNCWLYKYLSKWLLQGLIKQRENGRVFRLANTSLHQVYYGKSRIYRNIYVVKQWAEVTYMT